MRPYQNQQSSSRVFSPDDLNAPRLRRALDALREIRRGRTLLTSADVFGGGGLRYWDARRIGRDLDFDFGDEHGIRVIGGKR